MIVGRRLSLANKLDCRWYIATQDRGGSLVALYAIQRDDERGEFDLAELRGIDQLCGPGGAP